MRLLNLLTNTNRWDSVMDVSNAFDSFRKHDHSASFDSLGPWLDQNQKTPKRMKNIYKIAASLVATALILVACTVPVEQEEEIGYMIKGIAKTEVSTLKQKLVDIPGISNSELSITPIIHEQEETGATMVTELTEVIMILPEADYDAALQKKAALNGAFQFDSIEILPIEDKIERPLYEVALNTFDFKLSSDTPDSVIAVKIDKFLHENSSVQGNAQVIYSETGERIIEIREVKVGSFIEIKQNMNEFTVDSMPLFKLKTIEGSDNEINEDAEFEVIEVIEQKRN